MRKQSKLTRGVRNKNPLNIRISNNKWIGKIVPSKDKDFEQFDTLEHGIRAGIIVLRTYINKYNLHNIDDIIGRFAPECENNLHSYTSFIRSFVSGYGFDCLDYIVYGSELFKRVVQAMLLFESRLDYPYDAVSFLMSKYCL